VKGYSSRRRGTCSEKWWKVQQALPRSINATSGNCLCGGGRRIGGSEVQEDRRYRRFGGSEVRRFGGSEVRRFGGSAVRDNRRSAVSGGRAQHTHTPTHTRQHTHANTHGERAGQARSEHAWGRRVKKTHAWQAAREEDAPNAHTRAFTSARSTNQRCHDSNCTLLTAHCTPYTIHNTPHTTHYTLYTTLYAQ
jgi:hypothetical protein